jgi:hypothetical protein
MHFNGPYSPEQTKVLDKILLQIPAGHDAVFLLRAGMGEAYFLSLIIKDLITMYELNNPCIVCVREQYKALFQATPEIAFYRIKLDLPNDYIALKDRFYSYQGVFININPSSLPELQLLMRNYEEGFNLTYLEQLKEFNKLQALPNKVPHFVSRSFEQKVLARVKPYLDISNFAFIVNDANFTKNLSDEQWNEIFNVLASSGIDTFINSTEFSLPEAYVIAKHSRLILGLRCGFTEYLSTLNTPKHILYTDCKHFSIRNMKSIFSLEGYPGVNPGSLFEYDLQEQNELPLLIKNLRYRDIHQDVF